MIEIDMYSQTSAFVDNCTPAMNMDAWPKGISTVDTPPAINIDHIAMESVNLHGRLFFMEVFCVEHLPRYYQG